MFSCAVIMQLICAFIFAYVNSRFSHDTAHILMGPQDKDRMADIVDSDQTGSKLGRQCLFI